MKRIIILILLVLWVGNGWAATYYMRADGTAANKGAATSCSDASTAMSVAKHNAETFSAGDIIAICSAGGDYTATFTVPSSGSSVSSPITYQTAPGSTVVIDATALTYGFNYNNKNYIVFDGSNALTINGGSTASVYCGGVTGPPVIKNMTVNGSGTNGKGVYFNTSGGTIQNVTGSGKTGAGAAFTISGNVISLINNRAVAPVYVGYAVTSSGTTPSITSSGNTSSGAEQHGFSYTLVTGTTISITSDTATGNGTVAGTGNRDGFRLYGSTVTDVTAHLTDLISTGNGSKSVPAGSGMSISGITFTAGSYNIWFTATNNGYSGLYTVATSNLNIINPIVGDNGYAGIWFSTSGSAMNVYATTPGAGVVYRNATDGIDYTGVSDSFVRRMFVWGNGAVDATNNGDGISCHNGSTGMSFTYNLLVLNRNAGFAHVGNPSGSMYGNTIVDNGDSTSTYMGVRGGIYIAGTGIWNIKNNILKGNYPAEITGSTDGLGAMVSDYNEFYHIGTGITETHLAYNETTSTYYTFAQWQAIQDANSKYGDPKFISSTNFNLQPDSPAINAGTLIDSIHKLETAATDYAGTSIYRLPDIGAYQYPDQGVYFNKDAASGGNGTKSSPYNAFASYPSWAGYALRAGGTVFIKGTFSTGVTLSSLTSQPTVKGWPGSKFSAPINGATVEGTNIQSIIRMR